MRGQPTAREVFSNPVHCLAFGFGAGLAPRAPGTAGTLVGVVLDLLLRSAGADWPLRLAIALAVAIIGIGICGASARMLGEHDHPGIVWDEIAGIMLTLVAAPDGWTGLVAGFVMFRFFDIVKPWPIRLLDERVGGGLGIMLDDLLAAIFAMAGLALLTMSGILA